MTAIPIFIGERRFKSRNAAAKAIRQLVARYPIGGRLDATDQCFVLAMLELHPRQLEKLAHGVSAIIVDRSPIAPRRSTSLWIIDQNGHRHSFSWRLCIGLEPSEPRLLEAARNAIWITMWSAGDERTGICGICRHPLTTADNTHVDHAPPWTFKKIVDEFVTVHGERPIANDGVRSIFACDEDRLLFNRFHDSLAQLRVVHAACNLRRGAQS